MAVTERSERPRSLKAVPSSRRAIEIATTKPGTPGGIFMRQFWHAIHRSADLAPGQAKPIRIMSEDYALYRGASGRPQVIDYRCPHRHAPMHLSWVEDDDIRCVYHGWKYDCSGQCIEQPARRRSDQARPDGSDPCHHVVAAIDDDPVIADARDRESTHGRAQTGHRRRSARGDRALHR
jgi:nitrite reductase/ring-hydroxylating ferredoxin subunit